MNPIPLEEVVLIYETIVTVCVSQVNFPEHILMTVPCRLIHSLEVAVNKKAYLWNLGKIFTKHLGGLGEGAAYFQVKLKCHLEF